MSVFLDNQPLQRKLYPDNSIIHTYNTKVFTDYNTAVEQLMYKVLCPGEITFAYYNDENSTYGINAIFAVGPLVHGGGNIIFRNALELQRIFDELNSTIIDINVSINKIKNNLFSSLCDVSTKLDQTVADAVDSINITSERKICNLVPSCIFAIFPAAQSRNCIIAIFFRSGPF